MSLKLSLRLTQALRALQSRNVVVSSARAVSGHMGDLGGGAGRGGGGGGSIRDAGGAFGKMEAAREEQYFRKLQKEQLDRLKEHLDQEVGHHEREIARHQEAIERHRERMRKIEEEKKIHEDSDRQG
ncbi:unnamed protein product [Cyprideis torosa]|uniref:ATP synthase F1 subunit epsilon n=1 Tax=Cyprideis torosa TaxID=163714 RepID=A0A7R8W2G1_9CRUS|nr:unnamed protein product [Cyprideis torosa]CAG0881928.1 unnamed protein product [Cyprideis torosa]